MSEADKQDHEDPKIIVDTDWKEQVAREKEASPQDVTAESDDSSAAESEPSEARPEPTEAQFPPPPPASFDVLVSMLFTQAMSMLGQMPDPATQETRVNKSYAKHYIDTLEMLTEKTEGNRTDEESKILSEALHALRMTYVNVKSDA